MAVGRGSKLPAIGENERRIKTRSRHSSKPPPDETRSKVFGVAPFLAAGASASVVGAPNHRLTVRIKRFSLGLDQSIHGGGRRCRG
jgi:hypothetical protein